MFGTVTATYLGSQPEVANSNFFGTFGELMGVIKYAKGLLFGGCLFPGKRSLLKYDACSADALARDSMHCSTVIFLFGNKFHFLFLSLFRCLISDSISFSFHE
jgi:hypothetical protein